MIKNVEQGVKEHHLFRPHVRGDGVNLYTVIDAAGVAVGVLVVQCIMTNRKGKDDNHNHIF